MKTACVLFALLMIGASASLAQETHGPSRDSLAAASLPAKFDPARDPAADLRTAVTEATRSHRRILLDVGGEWCIWCRRLDSLFATHHDLASYLHAHFVVVKVNYSKENKNAQFLSQFPAIPGYPHIFVLDTSGKLLKSQDTGELEEGKGHSPDKVLAFLKSWSR